MLQFTVDSSLCTYCGQCERDCVSQIIKQDGNNLPSIAAESEQLCIRCQHCLAVCPMGAISILGKSPADSKPISPGDFPSFDQMAHFVRGRRSIRHYKSKNVDPALIKSLLATLANVPTGVNASQLTFSVIDDVEIMRRFQERMIATLKAAFEDAVIPERYSFIRDLPDDKIASMLFRGAPHALIVSAPPTSPCPNEDTALAIANFELLAQSAGLGSVWWGFLRLFLSTVPELKSLLDLPSDHIFSAALFGYPDIKFARTVQRDDAAVIRRVSI